MCHRTKKGPRPRIGICGWWNIQLCGAVLAGMLMSGAAWAHKVNIFAWVEGDAVHTQSKFSGGKPAKDALVVVYDDTGNELLSGKTDDKGAFSFQAPKRTALTVALKASMGHLAEWRIPAEELSGATSMAEGGVKRPSEAALASLDRPLAEGRHVGGDRTVVLAGAGVSREEIKVLIDDALDKKLAPIVRLLAESVDRGPTVVDILGGLGYIVGLAGVALYAANRSRGK